MSFARCSPAGRGPVMPGDASLARTETNVAHAASRAKAPLLLRSQAGNMMVFGFPRRGGRGTARHAPWGGIGNPRGPGRSGTRDRFAYFPGDDAAQPGQVTKITVFAEYPREY